MLDSYFSQEAERQRQGIPPLRISLEERLVYLRELEQRRSLLPLRVVSRLGRIEAGFAMGRLGRAVHGADLGRGGGLGKGAALADARGERFRREAS